MAQTATASRSRKQYHYAITVTKDFKKRMGGLSKEAHGALMHPMRKRLEELVSKAERNGG